MNKTVSKNSTLILILPILIVLGSCKKDSKKVYSELFEPGKISTTAVEYSPSFSANRTELYFAKSNDPWGKGKLKSSIYFSVKKNNQWSIPEQLPFSGTYDDSDPHLTNRGKTLYFISKRPSKDSPLISADIWKVEKDETDQWGTPIRLSSTINSEKNEYSPRTDGEGNLYFASDREGGYGQGDLYVAKKVKDSFSIPQNLGNTINTAKGEWNLEVSQKGDLIIFEASQRAQNRSSFGDLYISFKLNNKWTTAQNIEEINTTGSDLYPQLVHNNRRLYFTSSNVLKSTDTNIYSIEFKTLLNQYRKNARDQNKKPSKRRVDF